MRTSRLQARELNPVPELLVALHADQQHEAVQINNLKQGRKA
jgi:hypothetical protein